MHLGLFYNYVAQETFIHAYSPLNSANLRFLTEVTLQDINNKGKCSVPCCLSWPISHHNALFFNPQDLNDD